MAFVFFVLLAPGVGPMAESPLFPANRALFDASLTGGSSESESESESGSEHA